MKYVAAMLGGLFVGLAASVAAGQMITSGTPRSADASTVTMERSVAFGLKADGHVAPISLDAAGRVLCSVGPAK